MFNTSFQNTKKNKTIMSNSPKIHFLKHANGKFLNIRENFLYESFVHASHDKNIKVAEGLIQHENYREYTVFTITEEEFLQELASLTTETVISGAYFVSLLTKFSVKLPTISQINKNLYNKCKNLLKDMEVLTKMHGEFLAKKEDTTDDVSGYFSGFINEVSKVQIYQTAEVTALLKAYQTDRESLLGITRTVLKHNNIEIIS